MERRSEREITIDVLLSLRSGELGKTKIMYAVNTSSEILSRCLLLLTNHKFVTERREGRQLYYSLTDAGAGAADLVEKGLKELFA